jgi:hypothetical protein
MEKGDPKDGEALRSVALELQKQFFGVEPVILRVRTGHEVAGQNQPPRGV